MTENCSRTKQLSSRLQYCRSQKKTTGNKQRTHVDNFGIILTLFIFAFLNYCGLPMELSLQILQTNRSRSWAYFQMISKSVPREY